MFSEYRSEGMTGIEVVAFVTGVTTVWLAARQNVWNWPIGMVNVSLYAWLFSSVRLYADAGLQVVYLLLAAYGWWAWLHGGREGGPLRVRRAPLRLLLLTTALAAAFAATLGFSLARYTDADVPLLDSALTGASLMAQFLMTRKYLESWPVWVAADVVYVGLFISRNLHLTALLYAVFTVLALYAWREWHRSWRSDLAAAA
jgi:nicotinamide mononucleotide transporter